MTGRKVLPEKQVLEHWVGEGLTQEEMAERIYDQTGERVTRNALSVAMARYGMEPRRARYNELIPWRVKTRHAGAKEARMLRRESRRRSGASLKPDELRQLEDWLAELKEQNGVVAYYHDSPEGFYVIPRLPEDADISTLRTPGR